MFQRLQKQVFEAFHRGEQIAHFANGLIVQAIIGIFFLAVLAWAPPANANPIDRSDLNNDYSVDSLDLEIFSSRYLKQDWQAVDWCSFHISSLRNERYFRNLTSDKTERYADLLNFIAYSYNCQAVSVGVDKSDLNGDMLVDLADLSLFSTNYLETHWTTVDWCLFHESTIAGTDFEGRRTKYYLKHFRQLLIFINDHFYCGGSEPPPSALLLENTPKFLARIADAPFFTGDYYITDPKVGSLFFYDTNLVLKAEIKGLDKPLGVAVDSKDRILVGNNGRDNIEVYDPSNGELLAVFGEGLLKMPTAISLDDLGNIYVTDSLGNQVQVFDSNYFPIAVIGKTSADGALSFPIDTEVLTRSGGGVSNIQEIYVADQGNDRIQVYDLEGSWLRSITFSGTPGQGCNWFTGVCDVPGEPPFTHLQALHSDSFGRLHVLDNFAARVLIFDPGSGEFLASYGEYGPGAGFLRVPMDVLVSDTDMAIVTSGDGDRIEVYAVP